MEDGHDSELKDLLQAYTVAPADDALLGRIVTAAANSKVIAFIPQSRSRAELWRYAAIAAVVAVIGFFSGYTTMPVETSVASQTVPASATSVLDKVIMGLKSSSEVEL